jgi:hypothetical protein
MIAIDANVLVYARRKDVPEHERAAIVFARLARGRDPWAIPWPCIYEYLKVVTHPRIFVQPTPMSRALEDLDTVLALPTLRLLGQRGNHYNALRSSLALSDTAGSGVYDASIAALCVEHGIGEFWTVNTKHFDRFTGLKIHNPLA